MATARARIGGEAARPDPRPQPHLVPRDPDPVEQQLQMILRVGLLAPALLVGAQRLPFRPGTADSRARPGRTTEPPSMNAMLLTSAATAGAAVVIPAATVNPGGGSACQRFASR